MDIWIDTKERIWRMGGITLPCAIGKNGAVTAQLKREGDGKTPLGRFPLRTAYVRQDRVADFTTALPLTWLTPQHGWCDDAAHLLYNQPVMLPFAASHESLWRSDELYDIIITIGHNDDPPVPNRGSAIFLHCCKYDDAGLMKPTLGCVAIPKTDLLALAAQFTLRTTVEIV